MSTSRRAFLGRTGAAAAGLAAGLTSRPSLAEGGAPVANVVLLIVDEHNPKYASVYGHPYVATPNLERLAAMGTVYDSAYCPSPLCMPSRSANVSGRYVHDIQCYNNSNAIRFYYLTYGRALADQGVYAVHAGKMDVYNTSDALGFSELLLPGDRKWPGDMNIGRDPLTIRRGAHKRAQGYGPRETPWRHDTAIVDAAVTWLETRPRTLDGPFTLCVNINAPHFPQYVTEALWNRYARGADLPRYGPDEASAGHRYAEDLRAHFETDQFCEEDIRGLRRGYLGCVDYADQQLGRLIDALEAQDLLANTVVGYAADHGEMLGKFGMWWKCSLYEDSVRVPMVVAGPGFAAGARVRTPVSLLDLQAALFHATGRVRPADWMGRPLQLMAGADPDHALFAEYHGHGTSGSAYMLRRGPWKFIYCATAPNQLFHLEEDPEELRDLAAARPDVCAELEMLVRAVCDPDREHARAGQFIRRQRDAAAGSKPA